MSLKRTLTFGILKGAHKFPTVGLLGSRQSGKTTLSQLIFKEHAYVSLEDIELRAAATNNPHTFLNAHRNTSGLIIDDFHYAPELVSHLGAKEGIGSHPGSYVLCAPRTQATEELLTSHLKNVLSLHTIHPLSLHELSDNFGLPATLDEVLYRGLLPGAQSQSEEPRTSITKALNNFVDKDIRLQGQVDNLTAFHTFIVLCAQNVGQVVNLTTLAAEAKISDHTARRWLTLLEEHQILFLVHPYHTDFGKRVIKSPKLYFYDPGIVCALLKLAKDSLSSYHFKVRLFENLIMSEIAKWATYHPSQPKLYFWRDKTDHEITCIIENDTIRIPVIVEKNQSSPSEAFAYWHKISGVIGQSFTVAQEEATQITNDSNQLTWRYMEPLFEELDEAYKPTKKHARS